MKQEPLIRPATPDDVSSLVELIRSLAEHVGRADELAITEVALSDALFGPRSTAESIVAVLGTTPVGYVLFSRNFASFAGHPGLFIEDFCVHRHHRRQGIGRALMKALARLARESGCRRIDWFVSDSNPEALEFWRSVGATAPTGRRALRLTEDPIASLAESREIPHPK